MKTYTPKYLLRKAIKATQASLDGRWNIKNKAVDYHVESCTLCVFQKAHDCGDCIMCPYYQYTNGAACNNSGTLQNWFDESGPKNFMAVRRELQATLRWLKSQIKPKTPKTSRQTATG